MCLRKATIERLLTARHILRALVRMLAVPRVPSDAAPPGGTISPPAAAQCVVTPAVEASRKSLGGHRRTAKFFSARRPRLRGSLQPLGKDAAPSLKSERD